MSFGGGKVEKPPTPAVARQPIEAPEDTNKASSTGMSSLIATTPTGLSTKANTKKSSLIGGGGA